MTCYQLPKTVSLVHRGGTESTCYRYAVSELARLLQRMGVSTEAREGEGGSAPFWLALGEMPGEAGLASTGLKHDGYRLRVAKRGIGIAAASAKGALNGVYELAERLGYLFLLPGEAGEWAPERPVDLPVGEFVMQPRFPFRGVFWNPLGTKDYTVEEWLRFYAKLRFNALSLEDTGHRPLADELGLRFEVGGHGLSKMLPRDLFEKKPELFRLFQPEDFNGKRMKDSNFCITNSEARDIIKKNFQEKLASVRGAYGIHAWADDLPAGGWCLCPSCRSFSPPDQSMLAMNLLAEAARDCGSETRIANIAYHDTMRPGVNISPAAETFLLFAPRERCYGHALDDPSCARNRFYVEALKAWRTKCAGIGDNHTFEYYFDQILFRGLYPFMPGVILDDMRVYQEHDIESHMSLQIAGPALAPDFNMLLFAAAHWDETLTAGTFCQGLAAKLAPGGVPAWGEYLEARGRIFTDAMRMCGHDVEVYLDYRWLPETTSSFAREMAGVYAETSNRLAAAADRLEVAIPAGAPDRVRCLAGIEAKRARFEAAELMAMHYQQSAVNQFAEYLNTGNRASAAKGCELLTATLDALKVAKVKAIEFGLAPNTWYYGNINKWLTGEFERKIANYRAVGRGFQV